MAARRLAALTTTQRVEQIVALMLSEPAYARRMARLHGDAARPRLLVTVRRLLLLIDDEPYPQGLFPEAGQ